MVRHPAVRAVLQALPGAEITANREITRILEATRLSALTTRVRAGEHAQNTLSTAPASSCSAPRAIHEGLTLRATENEVEQKQECRRGCCRIYRAGHHDACCGPAIDRCERSSDGR